MCQDDGQLAVIVRPASTGRNLCVPRITKGELPRRAARRVTRSIRGHAEEAAAAGRGRRDLLRVMRVFPELGDTVPAMLPAARRDLASLYKNYTAFVSPADMAISLELGAFLQVMCALRRPQNVLDLGSGFSSLVLRRYAAMAPSPRPTVVSVDDDPYWLERTQRHLEASGLDSGRLQSWDSFRHADYMPFDLVVFDLGSMETRERIVGQVLERWLGAGVGVLDDAHMPSYRARARGAADALGRSSYSLRSMTRDAFGRYATMVN